MADKKEHNGIVEFNTPASWKRDDTYSETVVEKLLKEDIDIARNNNASEEELNELNHQVELFNENKAAYSKLYRIQEEAGVDRRFNEDISTVIVKDNDELKLGIRTNHFSPDFSFSMQEGKLDFPTNLSVDQLKYIRFFLHTRGVSSFNTNLDDLDAKLKGNFEQADRDVKQAMTDSPEDWFDTYWKNLWTPLKRNIAVPSPAAARPETIQNAPDNIPNMKADLNKIDEAMSAFVQQRQGKRIGFHSSFRGDWFGKERGWRIYKDNMYKKDASPILTIRYGVKKINGVKKPYFLFGSPNGEKLPDSYYDEICGILVKQGCTHINITNTNDDDNGAFRTSCAKKGIIPVGIGLNSAHVAKMIETANGAALYRDELLTFKKRLAAQIRANCAGDERALQGMQKTITGLEVSVRLGELEPVYEKYILADIREANIKEDAPAVIGASNAAADIIRNLNEDQPISKLQIENDIVRRSWNTRNPGKEASNPYNQMRDVLSKYDKDIPLRSLSNEELYNDIYKALKTRHAIVAEQKMAEEQGRGSDSNNIEDYKQKVVDRHINNASRNLTGYLRSINQSRATDYTIPDIDTFSYDATQKTVNMQKWAKNRDINIMKNNALRKQQERA